MNPREIDWEDLDWVKDFCDLIQRGNRTPYPYCVVKHPEETRYRCRFMDAPDFREMELIYCPM